MIPIAAVALKYHFLDLAPLGHCMKWYETAYVPWLSLTPSQLQWLNSYDEGRWPAAGQGTVILTFYLPDTTMSKYVRFWMELKSTLPSFLASVSLISCSSRSCTWGLRASSCSRNEIAVETVSKPAKRKMTAWPTRSLSDHSVEKMLWWKLRYATSGTPYRFLML